jgi:uncharacterized membrane protein YfcA
MHEVAFVFAGFAVGLIVGLTGVGGGSLMTPILIFFFGIKPYLAMGTDLLFAAVTKAGGTLSLARQRLVPWRWWASCAPAAFRRRADAGGAAPGRPGQRGGAAVMTHTLGVALLLTAAAMLYKAARGKVLPRSLPAGELDSATRAAPLESACSLWRRHRHPGHADLGGRGRHWRHGAAAPVPLPAAAAHRGRRHCLRRAADAGGRPGPRLLGSVDWPLLAQLLAGSLPGIWLGTRLMHHTPDRLMRSLLSLLLAYAGAKLITI